MKEHLEDILAGGRPMTKLELANKEIERLNNIINELEKWLKEHSKIDYECSATIIHEQMAISMALQYLQELKGSEKK